MTDPDRYFAIGHKAGEVATGGAYFEVDKDVSAVELVPRLMFRPVVGDQLMASLVRFGPNLSVPKTQSAMLACGLASVAEVREDPRHGVQRTRPGF
jgi:hypothetical protein